MTIKNKRILRLVLVIVIPTEAERASQGRRGSDLSTMLEMTKRADNGGHCAFRDVNERMLAPTPVIPTEVEGSNPL